MSRKKVLLGHLNSMGDCLFATVIARQIKEVDYPGCHLTWAVNSKSKPVVWLNPYIDEIWEIPTETGLATEQEWNCFVSRAEDKKRNGDFDFVFLTQIIGDNFSNCDGGIRSSTYNNYPHKITVSHQPSIRLSEQEVENVRQFAEAHRLVTYKKVILVECGPDSFASELNPQTAYEIALEITSDERQEKIGGQIAVILSSNKQIASARRNIIDASRLSFRENAELTKYCDLFIGCASGISWLTTTNWAKKLNMILVINQHHGILPSMIYDHEYLKIPTDHIIEIKSSEDSIRKVKDCVDKVWTDGFLETRKSFNEKIKLTNLDTLKNLLAQSLFKLDFRKFSLSLGRYLKRNGIQLLFTPSFRGVVRELKSLTINKILRVSGLKKKTELIKRHK